MRKETLDFSQIPPLSENEVAESGHELRDLWMIHYKQKIFGPYHTNLMKRLAREYPDALEGSSACQLDKGKWLFFFDHLIFQDRDEQTLYRPVPVSNQDILVYSNEKEYGPYKLKELMKKLQNKSFKYVDLFSIDSGQAWRKIYEIEGLDRRSQGQGELKLPSIPETSAYTDEQLAFIRKTPYNHSVVLELKKISPQGPLKNQKAPEKKSRRKLSKKSEKPFLEKSHGGEKRNLLIMGVLILGFGAWFVSKTSSKNTPSAHMEKINSPGAQRKRTYQRKVTRLQVEKPSPSSSIPSPSIPDPVEPPPIEQRSFDPASLDANNMEIMPPPDIPEPPGLEKIQEYEGKKKREPYLPPEQGRPKDWASAQDPLQAFPDELPENFPEELPPDGLYPDDYEIMPHNPQELEDGIIEDIEYGD